MGRWWCAECDAHGPSDDPERDLYAHIATHDPTEDTDDRP